MNKKIISLCMILFILIICTTVNANEITINNNTTNSSNENIKDISFISSTEIRQEITEVSKINYETNLDNDNTTIKTTITDNKQDVQNIGETKNLIVKQDSSNNVISIKTEEIQKSTGFNITGIVTTAYDKANNVYAGGEEDGFVANGSKITLYNNDTGKKVADTTSNSEGYYQFLNLEQGNYTLKFKYGTYAIGEESIKITNYSKEVNYIFVPDITIIAFSGDNSGDGQADKINILRELSDRILFLESYELNNSYDKSNQWLLDFSNFILVDMYSVGNGFGVDTDLIAHSPASKRNMIAYVFGIYDVGIIKGTLGNWGFLGDNPHSLENTYVGSYWQTVSSNSTTIKTNMENLLEYIKYLLKETDVDPTTIGKSPLLLSNSWGVYYPGFEDNVKTPNATLINTWIRSNPGYNSDNAGSLNWMTEEYAKWNLDNNAPEKVLRNFEDWYTKNNDLNGSFVVISTYYEGGPVVDALIKEYEKQGRAVFSIYKTTSENPDMTSLLETAGNKSVLKRGVVGVSYMYWWTTGYSQRGGNYTINAYKHLNVSLINALKDISKFSYESQYGPQNEWTAAVTMPEFEGVYGALPVSYLDENKETVLIPEGIAKHVQITNGWARLRELNNSDKKISILVYGYPPGKANIGASYLDVFQSIHDLMERLYDNGYDIGMNKSEIPTTEQLNNIISDFSNKGLWAEGLIDSYVISHYDDLVKYGQLVNESQYLEWYNELPISLQEHVTQSWGSGLGNGSMIYREKAEVNKEELLTWLNSLPEDYKDQFIHYWNTSEIEIVISEDSDSMLINKTRFYKWLFNLPSNVQKVFNQTIGSKLLNESKYRNEGYFLIPGVYYGNIFLSVQPMRGWESQMDFHTSDLSPPQQYIAYYKYLSQILKTDAIIHMGTHGTLEWLPGRTLGLQSTDWPFQLTETPIIYPYIVSNPGEGMTAKERSFAQVLTHMTPVTSSTSLYGDYVELIDAISRYDSNKKSGVEDNANYYKEVILNLTESLGYEQPDYVTVSNYLNDYYIALNNGDSEEITKAKKELTQKATILGYNEPSDDTFDEWLEKVEKYINSDAAFEDWKSIIHQDIEAMSSDKINFGMHTLGKVWNDTELVTGVTSIASSRTTVLEDIMKLYYPEIKESYYDKIKDRTFDENKEIITGILKNIITSLVEGKTIDEVAASHGVFNNSTAFYQDLVEIENVILKVLDNKEWEYIFTALSGGYVEPGLSADPLYSDVLPTGRSMYTSDTTKIPSKSAWQSAVNSIDTLLIKYMVDLGEESYPELVGEVIWGTEVLRTEGISLAQFMYLMGVKPVWDQTGTVTGCEVIPLDDLTLTINGTVYSRPRIDTFATIVSNNPYWISLLTESVSKVNELNETFTDNYIKKHYNESKSIERLFGLPGAVLEGTGVSDLLNNAGTKLSESTDIAVDLADVYETRIGHSWNIDESGNIIVKNDSQSFSYLLEHVDLIIQNLDSTWRYLDSDDYVDWFGGLLNAANVHGSIVNTVLLDIRDKNNIVTSTLGEEVKRETRTTILNPQWLGGITTEVGGWNQMSMNFENLMKTMLTTQNYKENQAGKAVLDTSTGNNAGIIGNGLLRELAKTVTYNEYFTIDAQYKSYAFQSMIGWLLTSDMSGYWETKDNALRKDMLQKYIDNANRYGVACCHHTCGNINFHEWIIKTGASLGVKGLSEYSQVYASATKNPNAVYNEASQTDSGNPDSNIGSGGTGVVDVSEGIGEYLNQGATSEANAMATAGIGASGLSDTSGSISNAMSMASAYTDQTNSGNNNQEGENSGSGEGEGSGEGSGSSSNNGTTGAETGNNTNNNGTENSNSNSTSETGNNTNTENEKPNNNPEETNNNTNENTNNTEKPITKPDDIKPADSDDENRQNTTIVENSDSGAGESPSSGESASTGETSSSSKPASAVSSSEGGKSGSSAAAAQIYEVVEKSIGKPPSSQSEISIGYLLFVVMILIIFFIGFTKPNSRSK